MTPLEAAAGAAQNRLVPAAEAWLCSHLEPSVPVAALIAWLVAFVALPGSTGWSRPWVELGCSSCTGASSQESFLCQ